AVPAAGASLAAATAVRSGSAETRVFWSGLLLILVGPSALSSSDGGHCGLFQPLPVSCTRLFVCSRSSPAPWRATGVRRPFLAVRALCLRSGQGQFAPGPV